MNKDQIIKYLKNSIDEKGNYCYSLPIETTKAIIKYIDQLTNNWNELEKWIVQDVKDEKPDLYFDLYFQVLRKIDILDKMKEIKENNK